MNHYNPAITSTSQVIARTHDRGDWRTSLILKRKHGAIVRIEPPTPLMEHSLEDARSFWRGEELWISFTCSKYPATEFRCVVIYGKIEFIDSRPRITEWYQPKYGHNDFTALEKNFCPWVINGKLWFYYATNGETNTFIQVEKDRVVETKQAKMLPWKYGPPHGGCIVETPDGPLFFFNSRTGGNRTQHRYHIGCARLDPKTFDAVAISKSPILYGEEGVNVDKVKHYKPNVVFACGAIYQDGIIHLSYGWNDCKSMIAKLKKEHLKL